MLESMKNWVLLRLFTVAFKQYQKAILVLYIHKGILYATTVKRAVVIQ